MSVSAQVDAASVQSLKLDQRLYGTLELSGSLDLVLVSLGLKVETRSRVRPRSEVLKDLECLVYRRTCWRVPDRAGQSGSGSSGLHSPGQT